MSGMRRLGTPKPVSVRVGAGVPVAVGRAAVEAVAEEWVVEDRWWTGRPLRRRYFELVLADGRNTVVFRDLRPSRPPRAPAPRPPAQLRARRPARRSIRRPRLRRRSARDGGFRPRRAPRPAPLRLHPRAAHRPLVLAGRLSRCQPNFAARVFPAWRQATPECTRRSEPGSIARPLSSCFTRAVPPVQD